MSAVTRGEVLIEQQTDELCKELKTKLNDNETSKYQEDDEGILVRDIGWKQIELPKSLQQRVMTLAHRLVCSAYPGARKMYATLRQTYYWPTMALDCHLFLRDCQEFSCERARLRKHTKALVLFPANAPLESVAMDLLGPFLKTPRGNTHLIVITIRYSKLTKVMPINKTDAYTVAKAFVHQWVFNNGPPRSVLPDNGPPFSSKFLQTAYITLGVRNQFITTYNPKANGQTERYNRTLGAALRAYAGDNHTDWDVHAPAITLAYNTQVHTATGMHPFDLVINREIPSLTIELPPQGEVLEPRQVRMRWLNKLQALMQQHTFSVRKAQARYKRNFDRRLRSQVYYPEPSFYVFVRKDYKKAQTDKDKSSRKLTPRSDGPYFVKRLLSTTAEVQIGDQVEYVSLDRLAPAPAPIVTDLAGPSLSGIASEDKHSGISSTLYNECANIDFCVEKV